jgi:hypothetical protein
MSLKETFLISPLSVRGCQLWLDAADTTTTTFSGTSLTQWTDKSSTGKTITVSGTLTRTANGRNGLQTLTTNGGFVSTSLSTAIGNGDYALFAVWYQSVAGTNGIVGVGINTNGNGAGIGVSGLVGGLFKYNFYQFGVGESSYNIAGPTFLMQEGIRIGGTNTVYINGDAGAGSTNSLNLTNTTLTVGAATSFTMSGQICEAIVYVGTIGTSDRQKIEGYLAWKWGLTSSLPSTHTYKNSRPLNSIPLPASLLVPIRSLNNVFVFNPTVISGCQLWLDAVDTPTVIRNGTSVRQWNDKSGNGRNFSQSTLANSPAYTIVNGKYMIDFIRANKTYLINASISQIYSNFTLFMIIQRKDVPTDNQRFFVAIPVGYATDWATTTGFSFSTALELASNGGGTAVSDSSNLNLNMYSINTGTNIANLYKNGNTTPFLTRNLGLNGNSIGILLGSGTNGGINTVSEQLNGYIGEVILFFRPLSLLQQQQIEGYLAWKWGLEANLPVSHPFRSNPPDLPAAAPRGITQVKSAFFNPRTFSGLQLWLDAGDRATITAGSTITGWTDKSGNSRTVTFAGTSNTYDPVAKSVNTDRASNSYFFANVNLKRSVTSFANVFIVYTWLGSATNANQGLWGQDIGGGWNRFQLLSFPSATSIAYGLSYTPSIPNVILVNGLNTGNRLLYCANYRYLRTNGTFAYVNGVINSSPVTEVAASPETATTNTYFGTIDTGFSGSVAFQEILIYTTDMPEIQRQSIEGYLAWKWGLVANLPSTHPFKLFPPPP